MITTLDYEENHLVAEALRKGYFSFKGDKIYYHLRVTKGYMLSDPEELVRHRAPHPRQGVCAFLHENGGQGAASYSQ